MEIAEFEIINITVYDFASASFTLPLFYAAKSASAHA